MRIVIDARRINSSTGHYAERLISRLESIDSSNEYTVLVLEKEKDTWQPSSANFNIVTTTADHYTFAEQIVLAWTLYRLKPDLVHFTMPQQPLLWLGPRVTTIHDTTLIRFENVETISIAYKIRKLIFTFLMRNVIWRSKHIITPTKYVQDDLDQWTKNRYSQKISFTHEAGDFSDIPPEPMPKFENTSYLFFVGNAFPYKNIRRIVDGFAELKNHYPDLKLLLAGKKDNFYEQIEKEVNQRQIKDVHFLGYISDGEKRWLFQNAVAYVVASLSEGFHIPLLEAMHEECPVVASNATCLPEVGGEAALYFDPYSTEDLVAKVTKLLENPSLRAELIEKGNRRIKDFSWERMAEETLEVYQNALK